MKIFKGNFFKKSRFSDLKFWSQLLVNFSVPRDYPNRFQHPQIICPVSIRFWKYCNPEAVSSIFCQKSRFYCTFFEKKSKNRFSSFWVQSGWKFICSNKGQIVELVIFIALEMLVSQSCFDFDFLNFSKKAIFGCFLSS